MSKTAVLAYSGGLDTTCIVAWLKELYGYDEVVAVLVDVGQEFDLEQSHERGYAAGADDVLLVDRKEAFANVQCAQALKTNALYEGKYPLVSALSRPVIAGAIAVLARQAGAYGIGRIDMIENRAIGIKSREVYEAPAAMTLIAAHRALEDIVLTKAELNAKRGIEDTWAKTVYDGLWFSPLREALDAFVDNTQELVTGEVRVELRPAAAIVNGRRSEHALYAETLASYATGETFPHDAAEGFIRLASLEAELAAARARTIRV